MTCSSFLISLHVCFNDALFSRGFGRFENFAGLGDGIEGDNADVGSDDVLFGCCFARRIERFAATSAVTLGLLCGDDTERVINDTSIVSVIEIY